MKSTEGKPPTLRLRVTAAAETAVRSGHPWVFSDSVREQNRAGETGELAVVFDKKDRFLAIGLYDDASPIRLRVLHAGQPVRVDHEWWEIRLKQALDRRAGMFDATTTGYRLVHGESDGWPGLVLDRFDGVLVMKLYTAAWLGRLAELVPIIQSAHPSRSLVLRLSRNIQDAAQRHGLKDGRVLAGESITGPVVFTENGIRFEADVVRGQKTGFFLDQRENRKCVGELAKGRAVLNAFSFSGGFSLQAAAGGAKSVTDLDISAHALESARRNFALNAGIPGVSRCQHECVQADAFEWLAGKPRRAFGLIVLDPPSLAKREKDKPAALSGYRRLAASALDHLAPDGVLVACSCSAHVSGEEFFGAVLDAARTSRRKFSTLKTTAHPADHPAGFKEAAYLKGIYLKLGTGK